MLAVSVRLPGADFGCASVSRNTCQDDLKIPTKACRDFKSDYASGRVILPVRLGIE